MLVAPYTMTTRGRTTKREIPAWARALKLRRVEIGLSQEDVAVASNDVIQQSTISALEVGKTSLTEVSFVRVVALAKALNWSLVELQRATGVDLGITGLKLASDRSMPVYPLSATAHPEYPGSAVGIEDVPPTTRSNTLIVRADTEEMNGVSPASIRKGEHVYIHLGSTQPTVGYVYAIQSENQVHLRRYEEGRFGPVWVSENRNTYEDIPGSEASILGLVYLVTSDPRAPHTNQLPN
ncbi:helix-turn-helix transcriptional regulator [Deinococcus radiomollis]|uniref:helix-turn-helix domain-containing protein n=1 Tax=Deinococcus radiomollis TaxID=468916 RepID=UPI003892C815